MSCFPLFGYIKGNTMRKTAMFVMKLVVLLIAIVVGLMMVTIIAFRAAPTELPNEEPYVIWLFFPYC